MLNKTIAIVAGICAYTGIANRAEADTWHISMGGQGKFVPFESMDGLTESNEISTFDLAVGRSLPIHPRGWSTEVELGWNGGQIDGTTFQRIDSQLEIRSWKGVARAKKELWTHLYGVAQAGIGMSRASLRLREIGSGARPLRGVSSAALTSVGVGMEWRWFGEKQPISFRIRGTIGYELSTDFNFSMSPESAGDDVLELPTQSTPIGSVNSSGATVGLTLVAGF